MKTIEERAIDYASHSYIEDGNINTYIDESEKQSYIQGATEQKALDIDKVCEWLCECCPAQLDEENDFSGCVGKENSGCPTLESLINAMEEQL